MKDNSVNHPYHYLNRVPGIECIDVSAHFNFCLGNAIKYIWRCDDTVNGIEDLRKAVWYINREIEMRAMKEGKIQTIKTPHVLER